MNIPNTFPCIIPARYESTRFPGKPLTPIDGVSMLRRVYGNAHKASMVDSVTVATDDEQIYKHCEEHGMNVEYTSRECDNGSVRVAEVASKVDAPYFFELQGDQPLVSSTIIDEFLSKARDELMKNGAIDIVQPYAPITPEQRDDVDVVKVVVSHSGKFLSFSRKPLETGFRTLGLYLWRKETLAAFPKYEISDYENSETTHLIRFVMNDLVVQGVRVDDTDWVEVDRPEHVQKVENILLNRTNGFNEK